MGLPLLTSAASQPHLSDYIRPFVGTQGEGNTYPGPSAPFGMIQLGPDTDRDLWDTASGYEYTDTSIMGFSLTHLNGTGIPDLGDFLFMPQIGEPKLVAGTKENPDSGYRARYSHDQESASAGCYKVKLLNNNVTVELAAGDRAGMMRFTFPQSDQASIMTDLQHFLSGKRFKLIWSHVRVEDNATITGFHLVNGWAKERYLYFAARYSRPFDDYRIMSQGRRSSTTATRLTDSAAATRRRAPISSSWPNTRPAPTKSSWSRWPSPPSAPPTPCRISIPKSPRPTGTSTASCARPARSGTANSAASRSRAPQWDKETFYTGMYHAFLAPNLYEDVTGEYRGLDSNIHQAKGFKNYAVFSLWDTFRATHPLFALIQAQRDSDMINSLLAHYDQSVDHLLPMWSLQGNETWCMIGYHAVPVIVDGYLKGVKGFDKERAYQAIKTTAMNPDYDGVAAYARLGWVPCDLENESVSKTLEYAFDDYCVAQMAKALGKNDDYDYFMRRAASYKNVFDPSTSQVRGKDSQGNWRTPFDPHAYGEGTQADFTEATATQYTFYNPQDVPAMIALIGGREKFVQQLDALFDYKEPVKAQAAEDIQGRIGEYWHGNEPSHHIIYLYCYAGQPWKAARRLHEVIKTQYGNQPNSLSGNDDCGQMSAWYIFTALGFYPVCPASDYYVIGSPAVKKAVIHLSNGKKFTMLAENLSDQNIYVQSVKLNGRNWNTPFLPYRELKTGGTIVFTMGPEPNKDWGTNPSLPRLTLLVEYRLSAIGHRLSAIGNWQFALRPPR